MRSFYLRIRVYAIEKYRPKFIICDVLLHLPRIYAIFNEKVSVLMKFFRKSFSIVIKIQNVSPYFGFILD